VRGFCAGHVPRELGRSHRFRRQVRPRQPGVNPRVNLLYYSLVTK
jgi:hypothetical protein